MCSTMRGVTSVLMVLLTCSYLHVVAQDDEGEKSVLAVHDVWFNRSRDDHPDHENHEFVSMMSGELVDTMLRRRGLRGFERMISKACGGGRRSVAHFSQLVQCLRGTKDNLMEQVEKYIALRPNLKIRDHIAVTTFCGVLPRIVACKIELCEAIDDCESYSGFLELVNEMHLLLIRHYCADHGVHFMDAVTGTSRDCARHMLSTVHECWGRAGLDYADLTSVLRRLSKKEMLCQQLVGTQQCLSELYQSKEQCRGGLAVMVADISAKIKKEFSCYKFGQEGRHLLGL